jgi:hypothetical protein
MGHYGLNFRTFKCRSYSIMLLGSRSQISGAPAQMIGTHDVALSKM